MMLVSVKTVKWKINTDKLSNGQSLLKVKIIFFLSFFPFVVSFFLQQILQRRFPFGDIIGAVMMGTLTNTIN